MRPEERELFRQDITVTYNRAAAEAALNRLEHAYELGDYPDVYRAIAELDQMDRIASTPAAVYRGLRVGPITLPYPLAWVLRKDTIGPLDFPPDGAIRMMGRDSDLRHNLLEVEIPNAFNTGSEAGYGRAKVLIRVAHLMGLTDERINRIGLHEIFDRSNTGLDWLEALRQAAATGPMTMEDWPARAPLTGKSAEWVEAMTEVEQAWENLKRSIPLPAGSTHSANLERFVAAMGLLQEEFLTNSSYERVRLALRLHAKFEYLLTEIWKKPKTVRKFFDRMRAQPHNVPDPTQNPACVNELKDLDKVLFIPDALRLRTTNLTREQKRQISRFFKVMAFAFHIDRLTQYTDADPNLRDLKTEFVQIFISEWDNVKDLARYNT